MELLKKQKISAGLIAEKFGVSRRTVYRAVDVLSANNVAIFAERGRYGGLQLADSYRLPAALLTAEEQKNILTSLNLFKTAYPAANIEIIRNKILAVNTQATANNLFMTGDKLMLDGSIGDSKLYRAKIEPLSLAIDEMRVVNLVYHDRGGEITQRSVRPHAFVLKDYVWYLYAFCELREGFRMFKISRIEKLLLTDRRFARIPRDEFTPWKLDADEQEKSVDIVLYVAEEARYDVEEWLGVECVRPLKNAKFPYIAEAAVAHNAALVARLTSYGAAVKIISPKTLENQVVSNAKALISLYR